MLPPAPGSAPLRVRVPVRAPGPGPSCQNILSNQVEEVPMASKPKPEDLIQLLQGRTEPELEVLIRVMRRAFGDAAVDAALEAAARREAAEKVREYLASDDASREVARIVADGLGLPAEHVLAVLKGRSRQIGPGGPERSAGQAGPDRNWVELADGTRVSASTIPALYLRLRDAGVPVRPSRRPGGAPLSMVELKRLIPPGLRVFGPSRRI